MQRGEPGQPGEPGEPGQPGTGLPGGVVGGIHGGEGGAGGRGGQGGAGAGGGGITTKIKPWHINAALIAIIISLIGGSVSLGKAAGTIQDKLDRNCRILNTVQADVRFLIIEAASDNAKSNKPTRPGGVTLSEQFRQIFGSAGQERCG